MSKFDEYYPKVLPWSDILEDLRKANVGPFQVARLIDVKWSTFQNWGDRVEPRHSYATSILQLHKEKCGESLHLQRLSQATIRYSS